MNHGDAREHLEAYLDGELDRATLDELEAHLPGCADCQTELAALERLRAALRAVPRQRAPAQLRHRLATAELPRQVATPRTSFPRPWALAATLLLGALVGVLFMTLRNPGGVSGAGSLLARDLMSSHLRALAAASPFDVISEDRHTVKPWFAGKIGESPPVEPGSEEFPLLGGRIDYVGGTRTAVIVYGHRKHVIDVFLSPGADGATAVESQGYSLVPCRLQGRSAWVVSDMDADSVVRFRQLIHCGA
jgi:anti-sigma factor (TIGR02949 family)